MSAQTINEDKLMKNI